MPRLCENAKKVVWVGDYAVGKSSLIDRLRTRQFHQHLPSTLGAEFTTLRVGDTHFQIWDTAGQERFRSLVPMYFRDDPLVCLTITEFEQIADWHKVIPPTCTVVVVVNKIDLGVSLSDDELLAITHPVIMCSAKTGEGLNELIDHMLAHAPALIREDILATRAQENARRARSWLWC